MRLKSLEELQQQWHDQDVERQYLGARQRIRSAVNDHMGIEPNTSLAEGNSSPHTNHSGQAMVQG